jgi:hypothetical protein
MAPMRAIRSTFCIATPWTAKPAATDTARPQATTNSFRLSGAIPVRWKRKRLAVKFMTNNVEAVAIAAPVAPKLGMSTAQAATLNTHAIT